MKINHYVPSLEEIRAANDSGMSDREIIKLCKKDPSGKWFEENKQSMIKNGAMT